MKLFGPLLWYHPRLRVHYDYEADTCTFKGSRIEELESRQFPYEVFPERLADGILVSRTNLEDIFLVVKEDGKYVIKERGKIHRSVRDFARLPNYYCSFADPGTWSYVHRFNLPDHLYDTDGMIDYYNDLDFDLAGSVDWPIIDTMRIKRMGKLRSFRTTDRIRKKRVAITLELAQDFISRCNARQINFIPFGTAQGYDVQSYRDSVRRICKMGYEYIAVGGMPAYSERQVLELLPEIWDAMRRCDSRPGFHLYGRHPSPSAVPTFLRCGVTSFDNTSAALTHRLSKGYRNYYDPGFRFTGDQPLSPYLRVRIPPKGNPTLRRLKTEDAARYSAVDRLIQRSFSLYSRYVKHESERDKRNFLKVYKRLVYSLNDSVRKPSPQSAIEEECDGVASLLDDKPWKSCDCTSCRNLGGHVMMARANRTYWMLAHNVYIAYARLARELEEARRDGCGEPFYDYEKLDKFVESK